MRRMQVLRKARTGPSQFVSGSDRRAVVDVRKVYRFLLTFAFVATSRAVGLFRELVISLGYGLGAATDLFYQLTALPTYTNTFVTGPFATAYIAWSNQTSIGTANGRASAVTAGVLSLGFVTSLVSLVGGLFYSVKLGSQHLPIYDVIVIAPSCFLIAYIGFAAAIQNSIGRYATAQGLQFLNNACFVLFLALGTRLRGHVDLTLSCSYSAACLVASGVAWRLVRSKEKVRTEDRKEIWASILQSLLPQLGYASVETLGAVGTQAMILYLAARSGVGVTSAAAVASRLCLTVNGLLINPLSSMAMVNLGRHDSGRAKKFVIILSSVLIALMLVAVGLIATRPFLLGLVGNRGKFSASNAAVLFSLIPAYSAWMVALGLNLMLARLSFAMGRARLFTLSTLLGYLVANTARVFVWSPHHDFALSIILGAFVELTVAVLVMVAVAVKGAAFRSSAPSGINPTSAPTAVDGFVGP